MPRITEKLRKDEQQLAERLSKILRDIRKDRGLTQAQMAKVMGTAQDMVSRFENAERLPTLLNWLSLSRSTGIDPYLPLDAVKACEMRTSSNGNLQ